MKAILDALNVVYEEKEKRGLIKLNLVTRCFTLAAIAALLLALGAVVVMPIALNFLGLHEVTDLLLRAVRWPVLLALIILAIPQLKVTSLSTFVTAEPALAKAGVPYGYSSPQAYHF